MAVTGFTKALVDENPPGPISNSVCCYLGGRGYPNFWEILKLICACQKEKDVICHRRLPKPFTTACTQAGQLRSERNLCIPNPDSHQMGL